MRTKVYKFEFDIGDDIKSDIHNECYTAKTLSEAENKLRSKYSNKKVNILWFIELKK